MSEQIDKLLEPISVSQPCGPDLSNDPSFDELEKLLKGKPEIEIGTVKKPAEPPDWQELRRQSAEFLGRSKHLRVAVILCCASIKTGGVAGFRDGLRLILVLLERHWAAVYPLLDASDNNDPTQRLNIVGALTAGRGASADWLRVVDYLYAAPVAAPKGAAAITFEQLISTKADSPDGAKLITAIRSANLDLAAVSLAIEQSSEAVRGIDQFLTKTVGNANAVSFEGLEKILGEMAAALKPLTGGQAAGQTGGSGTADAAAVNSFTGAIRSRADVLEALENICTYYQQAEPSSPVPFLLRRAQRLAKMDFVQAVQELNLANLDALRPSMGSAVEPGTPPTH